MLQGKFFPVQAMKVYMGSRGTAPLIFYLNTRWRRVVTSRLGRFTPSKRSGKPKNEAGFAPEAVWTFFFFEKRDLSSVAEIFEQRESFFFYYKQGTIKHMSDCQLSGKAMVLLHIHVWWYPAQVWIHATGSVPLTQQTG